jgi:hypothetical protein
MRERRRIIPTERVGLTKTDAGSTRANPQRKFIRHTAGVPIEVRPVDGRSARVQESVNVSAGGLSFVSETDFAPETVLLVRISEVDPPFEAHARVAWTRPEDQGFCIGVQFLDASDAFRARMVEQVCSIERYRCEVEEDEGRTLSAPDAAAEWIRKYAGRFPD